MGLLGSLDAPEVWLPVVFTGLMGLAILIYVVLDGYDLGVGMLMAMAPPKDRDRMIASIGPFWDANETWLVLGIGILLVAFPTAHGIILNALYIPVAVLLAGLILRGVAFDFRAKARASAQPTWDKTFMAGSLIATLAQGYMLGSYIVGFETTPQALLFGALTALCLSSGYGLVGAGWLILKTERELQQKAVRWARLALWGTALGLALVSAVTPLVSARIFEKWFAFPNLVLLAPLPILAAVAIYRLDRLLAVLPLPGDRRAWVPFAAGALLFVLGFLGLAYSFYPYIVPERMTIWEAASAPESLMAILIGAIIVLPCIIAYTIFAYRVFWGKVDETSYH